MNSDHGELALRLSTDPLDLKAFFQEKGVQPHLAH